MINSTEQLSLRMAGPEATIQLGEVIGSCLDGGEILELSSDIGGGKTTLTKGIVRGVGNHDTVTSPTFTVAKEYEGQKIKLYHYDFYRLNKTGVVGQELSEVLQEPDTVVVVEWSEIAAPLFAERPVIRIKITREAHDELARTISLSMPTEYKILIQKVKALI
jgi:tRNA threonylcarbamoyladenosine biosynthesis protein TsaE